MRKTQKTLQRQMLKKNEMIFEGIDRINFKEDYIDDDALFDEAYEASCEFEWECQTGR